MNDFLPIIFPSVGPRRFGMYRPATAEPFDVYMAIDGDDGNVGNQEWQPIRTVTHLNGILQPGWRVGVKRGLADYPLWQEQFNVLPDISIAPYGDGLYQPKFSAFDTLSSGGWTKTGGQVNIYERTLSGMTANGPTLVGLNPFEDGSQMTYYTSLANLDAAATLPGYYVANPGTATPTLYINASGVDKNPATNGKLYEYNKRDACIQLPDDSYTGWSVDGIWCRGGYQTGGVIRMGISGTVSNCKITDGNKYSLFMRDGCTVSGTEIVNGHHPTESSIVQILYNQGTPTGLGINISDMTLGWSSPTAPRISACNVLTGHYNTSGTFGALHVSNCTAENGLRFTSSLNALSSVLIEGCTITNFQYAFAPGGTDSTGVFTVRNCTWASNKTNQRFCELGTTGVALVLDNVSAVASASLGGALINITGTDVLSIADSDLTLANGSSDPLIRSTVGMGGFTSLRNTFTRDNIGAFYTIPAGSTWSSDNNVFDVPGGLGNFRMIISGTTYSTMATYQAAVTPNDANSTAI